MPNSPFTQKVMRNTPAVTLAADDLTEVMEAPYALTVTGVSYTPETDFVSADTNTRTWTLYNRGTDGNGTTVVARLAAVAATGTLANDDEKAITLSVTAADLLVAEGAILEWESLHVGTGIADPGGLVQVEFTRQDAA